MRDNSTLIGLVVYPYHRVKDLVGRHLIVHSLATLSYPRSSGWSLNSTLIGLVVYHITESKLVGRHLIVHSLATPTPDLVGGVLIVH